MTPGTYLDYNASAPIKPAVAEAMAAALTLGGNPSSVHRYGRAARKAVEDARAAVAALAGMPPAAVVFTSGGSEANALALAGFAGRRTVVSAIEHPSVLAAAEGAVVIPVGCDGVVDLAALAAELCRDPRPALVSVMAVNNETGVIQPIAQVAEVAHAAGALVHCDAVQAAGRIDVAMTSWGADLVTLSAHKIGGPPGVGALVATDGAAPAPLVRGGGQERGLRGGTENLPGIVGFGVAAGLAADDLARAPALAELRDDMERRLLAIAPDSEIFGRTVGRVANTSCLTMPGVGSETQVIALDLAGIAVSAGAACSSGRVAPSHVLRATGASDEQAASAIRISLGWASDPADIDRLVAAWGDLYRRRGARSAA